MINLATVKYSVLARLRAISPEELEQRLRAKGWDVKVTAKETKDEPRHMNAHEDPANEH